MGDNSGSRYGIVASLTEKKLALMSQADSLENDVNEQKQKLAISKKNLKRDQDAVMSEAAEHVRVLTKEIADYKLDAKNKCVRIATDLINREAEIGLREKTVQSRRESFKKQIAAIDLALTRIETISTNAAVEKD